MYYVYALIDPRNNKPFYIGKGSGNRVSTHEKFKSNCANEYKDRIIRKILEIVDSVPYVILKDGFELENDAYQYEEQVINDIGIRNLTNLCESRRPPSQKGKKRNNNTKEIIKKYSKKQGQARTIEYVKQNGELIYNVLLLIQQKERRNTVCLKLKITIDLFNKIKNKYNMYCNLINDHTDYTIKLVPIKKINGMRQKLFTDHYKTLVEIYELIDRRVSRRMIAKELNISLDFYDRVKNLKKEFTEYHSNIEEFTSYSNSLDYVN